MEHLRKLCIRYSFKKNIQFIEPGYYKKIYKNEQEFEQNNALQHSLVKANKFLKLSNLIIFQIAEEEKA